MVAASHRRTHKVVDVVTLIIKRFTIHLVHQGSRAWLPTYNDVFITSNKINPPSNAKQSNPFKPNLQAQTTLDKPKDGAFTSGRGSSLADQSRVVRSHVCDFVYFVDSLRRMTLSNARYILTNRNVHFHLGVVFLCVVYWVVLDLFDSSMPFRLVPWSVV